MALAGHPGVASADDGKTVYGSAFLDAFFEPGQEVSDAVKLRYKCRVAENQCARSEMWKIIFSNDGTRSYLQSGEIIELK